MKKLLALGILATALPLVMQQNTNNKDAVNVLNDQSIEQNPDLCALGYGADKLYGDAIVICDGIDFMQIGANTKYPETANYVLGKDVSVSNHRAPAATFTGSIDGRGNVITFSNAFYIYDADNTYNIGLFYKVGNGASFKNFEIKNPQVSYGYTDGKNFKIGTIAANLVAADGEVLVDNVKITNASYTFTDKNTVTYGGLFGSIDLSGKANMTIQNIATTTKLAHTHDAVPTTTLQNYYGGIAGSVKVNSLNETQMNDKIKLIDSNINSDIDTRSLSTYLPNRRTGGIFGEIDVQTNSIVNIQRNIITSKIYNSYGLRLDLGGSFGYLITRNNSKFSYTNSILKNTLNCYNTSQASYVGGITGVSVTQSSSSIEMKNLSLDTETTVSTSTTSSRMGAFAGHSNSESNAKTTYDSIYVKGTASNNANADNYTGVYAGGLVGYLENVSTTVSTHNFRNIIKYLLTPTSSNAKANLGEYFGYMQNVEPNTHKMIHVINDLPTRAIDTSTIQKNQLTYDFFTSGQIDMDIDAWQIQPNTEFVDTNGNITFYLRIDSKASNQVANNDPSQDDVFGLEEIFVPKTINWWFLLVIAAVLGFTFWLYMWNKNRKRYEK